MANIMEYLLAMDALDFSRYRIIYISLNLTTVSNFHLSKTWESHWQYFELLCT